MDEQTKGIVVATVRDNNDTDNLGRIGVVYPWLGDDKTRWLPVASPFGGAGRGMFMMPEVDDEALVAFEHGNIDHAYIVGFLWNNVHRPPTENPDVRTVKSREGHHLTLMDAEEQQGNRGVLWLGDAHGNGIVMTNGVVSIFSQGHLSIDAASLSLNGRIVRPIGATI